MISIRELKKEDLRRIIEINSTYPDDKISAGDIARLNGSGEGTCLVAEEYGKVVGFLLLEVAKKEAKILDVETDGEYLGTNTTGLLIEEAIRIATKMGATSFYKTTPRLAVARAGLRAEQKRN